MQQYPVPEAYTLPIQTDGRRLAKRADSTKRTKWVKCWSRVTSGSNRQKPHFHVNATPLWSRLILVSDQTGLPTWEVKYAHQYHRSCPLLFHENPASCAQFWRIPLPRNSQILHPFLVKSWIPWIPFHTLSKLPWVPEATRLLNPAGQRLAKWVWGPKWAKGRTRVASGGEPQWSRYVWYRFCSWSLIGYSKTCFFQWPQLVRRGHVKWTGFFSKTEWCLVEKKCVQRRDFIEGENLYSVSSKFEKQ